MTTDKEFDNQWFSNYKTENLNEHFSEIRTWSYLVFDQLDINHNGFIEISELEEALKSTKLNDREKSFVTFLLNNHDAIADSQEKVLTARLPGLSRADIESYFKLISSLI